MHPRELAYNDQLSAAVKEVRDKNFLTFNELPLCETQYRMSQLVTAHTKYGLKYCEHLTSPKPGYIEIGDGNTVMCDACRNWYWWDRKDYDVCHTCDVIKDSKDFSIYQGFIVITFRLCTACRSELENDN